VKIPHAVPGEQIEGVPGFWVELHALGGIVGILGCVTIPRQFAPMASSGLASLPVPPSAG
jgi:hypothetical protein